MFLGGILWNYLPGLASFLALMLALEGMINRSLNDRMWSFASSDRAYSWELASAEKVGFAKVVGCSTEPIAAVIQVQKRRVAFDEFKAN